MNDHPQALLPASVFALFAVLLSGCGPNLFDRANNFWSAGCCGGLIVILDVVALIELAGGPKSTGDKVLWACIIIFFPVLGCLLYYFFGRA